MAWTTPTTRSTGYIVTASVWNSDIVANLIDLHAGNMPVGVQIAGATNPGGAQLALGYGSGSGGQYHSGTGSHYFRSESGPTYQAIYASAFNVVSDERFKGNIRTVAGALDKICALRGVSFEWVHDGSSSLGLIAQEVQQVFPDAVTETDDGDGEPHLSVNYPGLVGPLVEAVKELAARVEQLEAAK